MHKAILFLAALFLLLVVVYAKPIEGFTTLMGVNWTEMNEGTPAALYAKLPIHQPKVVDLAEAGIGDVQPSPPSAGTLPSAPAPQRSAETPNPYRDPTNEPAKYIQLLEVKENLQAFFGFQAFMLEDRNDPAIQIPLTRARADLSDLINVASVMERNPGLPSRINNKQLDDIRANLQYLREILHDLEASGAIQPQQAVVNVEGFTSSYDTENPLKSYIKLYLIPSFTYFSKEVYDYDIKDSDGQNIASDAYEKVDDLDELVGDRSTNNPTDQTAIDKVNQMGATYLNNLIGKHKLSAIPTLVSYNRNFDINKVAELAATVPFSSKTSSGSNTDVYDSYKKRMKEIQDTLSKVNNTTDEVSGYGTRSSSSLTGSSSSSTPTGPRATLDELKEFRNKVIAEITRLSASGTTDPVIQGRISLLDNIKLEIIDVIERLQDGRLSPQTVPIYKAEIDAALPYLGKPSDPLPQLIKDNGLPEAIRNLFPGGLSPKDEEQAKQINNIVKGYMKNLFEGSSWGINLSYKYDNPNITKLQARTAEDTKRTLELLSASGETPFSTGLPGVSGSTSYNSYSGYDSFSNTEANGKSDFDRTYTGYESGLPGTSVSRLLPEPKSGGLDWKERSEQIREQIRKRGLNPADFGALPENAIVSDNFSWRGYTQMMCMRLNTTTDPGLARSVGCPSQTWQGWRE
jgi:hypothetical protein